MPSTVTLDPQDADAARLGGDRPVWTQTDSSRPAGGRTPAIDHDFLYRVDEFKAAVARMVELLVLVGVTAVHRDVHIQQAAFAIDRDSGRRAVHVDGRLVHAPGP